MEKRKERLASRGFGNLSIDVNRLNQHQTREERSSITGIDHPKTDRQRSSTKSPRGSVVFNSPREDRTRIKSVSPSARKSETEKENEQKESFIDTIKDFIPSFSSFGKMIAKMKTPRGSPVPPPSQD